MTSEPALVVSNLTFQYHTRSEPAIQDISFSLDPGQFLLIAGSSGCGKTTLIRSINGLIPRSYKGAKSGQVLLYGKDATTLTLGQISQTVGTVLQDPERQIVASHVINEVAFGLENMGVPRPEIRLRVMDVLERLSIAHLAERETFQLSGGEKQKVALAGVLVMRPSILLLDEPLASLDPASAKEALALVRRLADEGIAIAMIEHRVEDVLSVHPDRALYMQAGRVIYDGTAAGLTNVVDYREVKLPAPAVIQRVKAGQAAGLSSDVAQTLRLGMPGGQTHIGLTDSLANRANKSNKPLVAFQNVSFSYAEGPQVLKNVSLDIQHGDIIAVLGPNGAGKTTLVKHAIGLLKPTQGRVLVNGQDTRQISVAQTARTVGYVFQSPTNMLFAPTVNEELAFGPRNLAMKASKVKANVEEAVRNVNLSGLEQYPPLALSFGQQKRVSIAAVLSMGARILIMDEPTAGQDYYNYTSFMDAILAMSGIESILFITHDLDLAVIYANRVILVGLDGIAADGAPYEVLKDIPRLESCRVVPTSLLHANLNLVASTGRFLRAEALAPFT